MPRFSGLPVTAAATIVVVVIANLGNNIVAPVMPALKTHFGASAAELGLVASGFGLGRLAMDLPAGYLTDRVKATRLFTIGILVSGVAAALAAFSGTLQQLIIFRTAMGLGSAIMSTVSLVLLVNLAPVRMRGQILAFYTSAMLFGQAVSPSIGGYLATLFDWRAAFIFCAITPFVSLPLNLLLTARDTGPTPDPGQQTARHRAARSTARRPASQVTDVNWPALSTVYLSTFTNFFNRHGMRAFLLPLFGGVVLGMDPATIGNILMVGSVATIVLTIPSGAAGDRFGRKPLLIPGMLLLASGNLFIVGGDGQWIFTIATVLVSMGVLANSQLTGMVADLLPERLVGRGMGMYRFVCDVGVVLGPFVFGLAIDRWGFAAGATIGIVVVMASVIAILLLIPRHTAPPEAAIR